MPTHQFKKEDPKTFEILPNGPYLLQVIGATAKISDGAKTRGCEMLELFVKSEQHGTAFYENLVFPDESTDPKSAEYLNNKINTFLCSVNFGANEGEKIDITAEAVLGCRGWAHVKKAEYKGRDKNEIQFWYTNKEKLPRAVPPPEENAPDAPEADEDPWKV